ncbi:MAG: CoA-binding protein, partial [Acidimicrobiales bacterium]
MRDPSPQVRAMLEARRVAIVGASPRPGSLAERLLAELERSEPRPEIHLVNPRYQEIGGRRCVASLTEIDGALDLVALAVGDHLLEAQLLLCAERGDRGAVIFGSVVAEPSGETAALRARISEIASSHAMAVCGGGCMGFVNQASGLRAIGYLERHPFPGGSIALVTHSGSAFSAILRADRRLGFLLAVSSGQE